MTQAKSIVIVGGGAIGLCSAYYAAQQGHRVTVIERGDPQRDCCSLGNAGMIVPSHFIPLAAPGMVGMGFRMMFSRESPFTVKPRLSWDLLRWGWSFMRKSTRAHVRMSAPILRDLNLASRQAFVELSKDLGDDFGLTTNGLMMLCKTHHGLDEEAKVARMAQQYGVPAEVLTPNDVTRLNPGVDFDIAGGVYFPKDAHITPERFLPKLTQMLEQRGVQFRWSSPVQGWRTRGKQIIAVETASGEVGGDEFVLAAGSWSQELTRGLNVHVPLQAGKGYSVTVPTPVQKPAMGLILTEARVAITPMQTGLRIGGTMEVTGLDLSISESRLRGIFKSMPNYLPKFRVEDFTGLPVWSGLRPCSPDGLPYIGRTQAHPNLAIATGHAMMGLSLAPITGRLVGEIVSQTKPSIELSQLSPDRYQ